MLKLFILRHAKASRPDYPDDDYERPLTKGGAIDAAKVGKYLKRKKLRPDLVLCSGAVRTRATLKLVLGELGEPAPEQERERRWPLGVMPSVILGVWVGRAFYRLPDGLETIVGDGAPRANQCQCERGGDQTQ